MRRHRLLPLAALTAAAVLAGCGGAADPASWGSGAAPSGSSGSGAASAPSSGPGAAPSDPTVLAAASLTRVFPRIDPHARYTFGGSGALETEVEQGAPADVYAAASPKEPRQLYDRGLVEQPVQFATNTLVLIVPRSNPSHITSVAEITRPGVKLVICDATVPCGDYARNALANLGITARAMRNVVSQTTDVTQTVAEVALGQADAGFVYITDARAAGAKVSVVRLPAAAKPQAEDYLAVLRAARHPAAARAFVRSVLSAGGQAKLRAAGFGAP